MSNLNLDPLHYADLQKSGLSDYTIGKAGIISVPPDQIDKYLGHHVPSLSSAYEIPYPGCNDYSRLRCFYEDGKTGPKYLQRKDSKPRLYIPPRPVADLPGNSEVYIVWGEKKALKAYQEGLICIGIGGVRDWDNGNGGLIPDFDLIYLKNCIVHIVPDNDWRAPNTGGNSNDTEQSINQLAAALYDRRGHVKIVILPDGPEKGLDDYLCTHTADDLLWLPEEAPQNPGPLFKNRSFIDELNQKHAAIEISGRFCILKETINPALGHRIINLSTRADFKNSYGNRFIYKPHPDNPNKRVKCCIADEWHESEHRRQYDGIVFEPGRNIPGYYNLWQGFAITPKPGNWSLMRDHIFQIICRGNESIFQWVMAWIARIVQDPGGDRPGTCIVLISEQGAGKGIFAREFGSFFGWHFLHLLSINQLTGRFNAHLSNVLFVFCDEALWDGSKKAEGVIKGIITEPTFPVEFKGKDIFRVRNHANVMIASNSSWVVPAGEKERRFCVLDVSPEKAVDTGYFKAIDHQMKNGGREAMLHDLLQLDITGINLRIIPKTHALTNQVIQNLESVAKFWLYCLNNPHTLPRVKEGEIVCVVKGVMYEKYFEFSKYQREKRILTPNVFGREIRKYCPKISDGRLSYGGRPMIYILPSLSECQSLFEKVIGMTGIFES